MPGILKMDPRGADAALGRHEGVSKKRTSDGALVNGDGGAAPADPHAGPSAVQGASKGEPKKAPLSPCSLPTMPNLGQLPPDLVQVAAEFYHPLSKMLMRVGQDCFNDLTELLQKMVDVPAPHLNGLPHGHGMANGQAQGEQSKQKKLLLVHFAQDNRAKFIKLLVLLDWGKKSSVDVAKLIDLFMWTKEQNGHMNAVDFQLDRIKSLSGVARQMNPDMRTALEVLATGRAAWIPDLDFIPPEPMSSDKALKLMRSLNTALSIRIIAHENLPRHLEKWRVESGRATFTVDGEFEFDVISTVDEGSEPWFFEDVRLLFTPAPSIALDSRFLQQLTPILNGALLNEGLEGCFNYLHNFTLTHKINVLASQALELLRTGWAGSLRVEKPHRALVVQYWAEKPGKKSWLEIGISSNKPKKGKASWRGPALSALVVRWFRQGQLVEDANLQVDWNKLCAERMLKHVVALHIGHLLRTAQARLDPQLACNPVLSRSDPTECQLDVSMGPATNKTTLSVEPVGGRYTLHPVTALSTGAEAAMNRPQDAAGPDSVITILLARLLLEVVEKNAQQLGWQRVARQAMRAEVVRAATNVHVLQYALYRPGGWSAEWALAAVVDVSGESWWICELSATGNTIQYAQRVAMDKASVHAPAPDRDRLAAIQRVAIHSLALHVNARALHKEGKAYTFSHDFKHKHHTAHQRVVVRGWVLHVKTADLLPAKPQETPWLEAGMQIVCQGFRSDHRDIWHTATGVMVPGVAASMKKLMSASAQNDFSFSEDGHFHILLHTPFGRDIIADLKARLRDADRLRLFAETLKKRQMPLHSSSLQQARFQYGQDLAATVKFGDGAGMSVDFGPKNPHQRVKQFMNDMLKDNAPPPRFFLGNTATPSTSLDRFCSLLLLTRNLLRALDAIAASPSITAAGPANPSIHAHAVTAYRLVYADPPCSFDIRLRTKNDRLLWHVEDNDGKALDLRPKSERAPGFARGEGLARALARFFREEGTGWFGVRNGVVAGVDAVGDALERLHVVVGGCAGEAGGSVVKEEGKGGEVGAARAPMQSSLQQQLQHSAGRANGVAPMAGTNGGAVGVGPMAGVGANPSVRQHQQQHQHQQQRPPAMGRGGGNAGKAPMARKHSREVIHID